MAVGDIYRVAIRAEIGSDDIVNVMHYRTTVSVGAVSNEPLALAQGLEDDFISLLQANQNQNLQYREIAVRGVTQPTIGTDHSMTAVGGAGIGELLPTFNAMLVLLRTGLFGRSYQGRFYVGGLEEGAQEDSEFNAGILANLEAALDDARTITDVQPGALTYSFELGVYSRLLSVFTPVQTVHAVPSVAIMSSRKPGRGS